MVPRWKRLTLRVFVTVPSRSPAEVVSAQEAMVDRMLQLLRIRATLHVVKVGGRSEARKAGRNFPNTFFFLFLDILISQICF